MSTFYQDLAHFSDDADNAWTLPGHYYYDEAVYVDELEQIFYRNWQYVCHTSQLKTPGRYVVHTVHTVLSHMAALLQQCVLKPRIVARVC